MTNKLLVFEEMSAILTGFPLVDIQGTGMSKTYLEFLEKRASEVPFNELMTAFEDAKADASDLSINAQKVIGPVIEDNALNPLVKNIIMMWYTGQWNYGADDTFVISSNAYIESFSFVAAGAHPQGAKQPGFATWHFPPNTFPDV